MYSRPKPGETEEDLLRYQDEFERMMSEKKIIPATQVVTVKGAEDVNKEEKDDAENPLPDIEEQLSNTFEAVPRDIKLNKIVERRSEKRPQLELNCSKETGFPKAKRRDLNLKPGRGSIFSQQVNKIKKIEPMNTPMNMEVLPTSSQTVLVREKHIANNLPSQSFILTSSESKQIHEENLNVIKNLSEEEIIEEREKLITTMDPALIAFLKSRRKKQEELTPSSNPTIEKQNEVAEDVEIEEMESTKELLTQPDAEKWLNFDVIEANKLAWMKDVDVPKLKKSEEFEARFDFEGWLLPYSEPEINEKNRVLYHHGDEPGRPGYTLQELFQLSRSSVFQQKIVALNTIANILSLYSTGVYDEIIDLPIEQIFFVIRFCLDDNTPTVLNSSIKALRCLIFSQVDETCLDSLLGFGLGLVQPILAVDNGMEDDNTVNDQQLAEKNLIKCLVRTEIFTRIRYIINTIRPSIETIVYCVDILVRLARDSDMIVLKMMNVEGPLDNIVKYFISATVTKSTSSFPYGLPLSQTVKLMRVLSARNKNLAERLLKKYDLMESVMMYLSDDTFSANVNGMRLQTECMHYWSLLIHYGFALNYFSVLQPILMNLLDYHFKNTNIESKTTFVRHGHVSALLLLLSRVMEKKYTFVEPFLHLIVEACLPKWTLQCCISTEYSCGNLQLIASLLHFLSLLSSHQSCPAADKMILKLIHSKGFSVITEHIKSGSMLLNNYETHKSSANLKSLEAAVWHTMDHVVPVIQSNSCIPLLYSFTKFVEATHSKEIKLQFLNHENIKLYLTSLQKLDKYFLAHHWFARPESFILMSILKTSISIRDHLDTSIFYELAVKCLNVFNSEQKPDIEFILSNIIFCSRFYPSEVLMDHLDVSQRNVDLDTSPNNLGEIFEVYTQVLGLKNCVFDINSTCTIDVSIGNVIAMDWIYTPILVLYSNQLQNKSIDNEEHQIFTVKNCLRWILIYETYFPFLAAGIDPTDKFCRLACVFLSSDSLFLIKEIRNVLELCFNNVIRKYEHRLDFNKKIQGLNNFQDFYTQLLEQYQSVSYGDVLFGNVILIPLAQRHNAQYRKTLWSEYMGAVQIFNITEEEIISDVKIYLEPPENDMSIVICYKRAISTNILSKNCVLYKIAHCHLNSFMQRRKANKR